MLKKAASLATLMLLLVAAGATADIRAIKATDLQVGPGSAMAPGSRDTAPEDEGTANLTAIHAIPGLGAPVDVFVNDSYLLTFDFNESAGPLALPRGEYTIEVRLVDGTSVLKTVVDPQPGKDYTVIAHLAYRDGANNTIAISTFENNNRPLRDGRTRITVRHTADAPSVDLDLQRVLENESGPAARYMNIGGQGLSNQAGMMPGSFGSVDLWGGKFIAVLYPEGSTTPAFESPAVPFKPGVNYVVYAIGSLFDGSFTLFVQTVDTM